MMRLVSTSQGLRDPGSLPLVSLWTTDRWRVIYIFGVTRSYYGDMHGNREPKILL